MKKFYKVFKLVEKKIDAEMISSPSFFYLTFDF